MSEPDRRLGMLIQNADAVTAESRRLVSASRAFREEARRLVGRLCGGARSPDRPSGSAVFSA